MADATVMMSHSSGASVTGGQASPPARVSAESVTWDALSEHVFFDRMEIPFRDALVRCARFQEGLPGSLIAERGELRLSFYLLMQGRVCLELGAPGRPVLVDVLSSGDVLGLSWVFPLRRWAVDVRAVDRVSLIALDEDCLADEIGRVPELAIAFAACAIRHQRLRSLAALLSA